MIGARLQPGQPELVQPLAHRADVNPGVVMPRRFLLQVHAAPAHHTMQCRIGPAITSALNSAFCSVVSFGGRPGLMRD